MMNPLNALNRPGQGISPAAVGFRSVLLIVTALFLVACAGTGGSSGGAPSANSDVAKRATDRWEALLAPDYDAAYDFYSPGYRSSTSRGDFELSQRLRKIHFTDAEFQGQECDENVCTLTFRTFYRIPSPLPGVETFDGNTVSEEKWIRTDGQWWFLPDD